MYCTLTPKTSPIHRHTGGLESNFAQVANLPIIHRHTGGLEKSYRRRGTPRFIHRHTGGLEKQRYRAR